MGLFTPASRDKESRSLHGARSDGNRSVPLDNSTTWTRIFPNERLDPLDFESERTFFLISHHECKLLQTSGVQGLYAAQEPSSEHRLEIGEWNSHDRPLIRLCDKGSPISHTV